MRITLQLYETKYANTSQYIEDFPNTSYSRAAKNINTNPNPIIIKPVEILKIEEIINFFLNKKPKLCYRKT